MIPKVIHYCWFGGNTKSNLVNRCIESWKEYCPDWTILEWNESNFDIRSNIFMAEAYDSKKWAFVSDVARLMVISEYGGVYLDTDVELLASIDVLLETGAFFAFESDRTIASGLGFGAEKGHKAVETMLRSYDQRHFLISGKPDTRPCPAFNTEALISLYPEIKRNGTSQLHEDVMLLSHGDYSKYAIHHGAASWGDNPKTEITPLPEYKDTPIKRFFRNPGVFDFIEKYLGKKAVNAYTFFAYDLLECGVLYFIRRLFSRLRNR